MMRLKKLNFKFDGCEGKIYGTRFDHWITEINTVEI